MAYDDLFIHTASATCLSIGKFMKNFFDFVSELDFFVKLDDQVFEFDFPIKIGSLILGISRLAFIF